MLTPLGTDLAYGVRSPPLGTFSELTEPPPRDDTALPLCKVEPRRLEVHSLRLCSAHRSQAQQVSSRR